MDRKIFHRLLYYLRPSQCTGNSIIYSIGCIRYLVPFQELLNQEHRGIKQATGYFKVLNQLYKHSSSEKTPCVSHSGQVIRRKDKFELPMPNTKPYMSEWTRFSAQTRKTGLPEKMQRYPKVDPYFRGKWSSPTDSRFLRVSTIMSLYKVRWAGSRHSHFSGVKSRNTSLKVDCAWNENTFHQWALRRVLIFTEKEKKWDR